MALEPNPRHTVRLTREDRLLRRLDRMSALTLVQALPGTGKTTLLHSWAESLRLNGVAVEWINAGPDGSATLGILRRIIDSAGGDERRVVIIDSADFLSDERHVHALLVLIADQRLVRVAIGMRHAQPVRRCAELRSLDLNVLTGSDLGLLAEDIPQFAMNLGYELDDDRSAELHRITGGWLLPTRMILDETGLQDGPLASAVARRYLREVVLPQVVEVDELEIAMRLAVPDSLSPDMFRPLLDVCLNTEPEKRKRHSECSGQAAIDRLYHAGLLERVPGAHAHERDGWRFPGLVRSTLLEIFESREPREAKRSHRRLAEYFVASASASASASGSWIGNAVRHARLGEDWKTLAEIAAQNWLALTVDFPGDMVFGYANIPRGVLAKYPMLKSTATLTERVAEASDTDHLRALLNGFGDAGKQGVSLITAESTTEEMTAVTVAAMISLRLEGRVDVAAELAEKLDGELLARLRKGERELSPMQYGWFHFQRSMTWLLLGDHERANSLAASAFEVSDTAGTNLIAANASAQLALTHTLSGDILDARRWLAAHDAVDKSESWSGYLIRIPAHVARVHLALDQLDVGAAGLALEEAGEASSPVEMWAFIAEAATRRALHSGDSFVLLARIERLNAARVLEQGGGAIARAIMQRCIIDLLLALGQLNRALNLLCLAGASGSMFHAPRARLYLISGAWAEAKEIASRWAWAPGLSTRDRIDLQMIIATAELELGENAAAHKSFSQARTLAADASLLSPFLSVSTAQLNALVALSGSPFSEGDWCKLAGANRLYPASAELIALTVRERVVLQHLVDAESHSDIASRLTVSVNTVKKQLASAYAKLGVTNRHAALARAHSLGII